MRNKTEDSMKSIATAVVLVVLLFAVAAQTATVKKKDGTTVTGELQGPIVFHDAKLPDVESSFFTIIDGKDISAIDTGGVHYTGSRFWSLLCPAEYSDAKLFAFLGRKFTGMGNRW